MDSMTGSRSFRERWRVPLLRRLVAPALLALTAGADQQQAPAPFQELPPPRVRPTGTPAPQAKVPPSPAPVYLSTLPPLDLSGSRHVALERQPAIAAARASLAVAQARVHALDNLRVPSFLARDLPVRKQQAALG